MTAGTEASPEEKPESGTGHTDSGHFPEEVCAEG